jgi:hypothetical protein
LGVFVNLDLAGWQWHGQPELDPNGASACVWQRGLAEPSSIEIMFVLPI